MKKILISIIIICIGLPLIGQTFGNAIIFDGIDDYMMVPHHESLNPGDDSWTIALWIKAPDLTQRGPLLGKRLRVDGYNQYALGIGDTDPHYPSPGKRLYYNYIDSAGVSERSGHLQDEFVDGNWHHIAVVANKAADDVSIYIDGILKTFIMNYGFGTWPDVGRLDSVLVARNSSGSHHFEGIMDELSLWTKALTQQQINTIQSDTLGPAYYSSTDSGLVAYYRFNEWENLGIGGGTDDIRDFSVWQNHGGTDGLPGLGPSDIVGIAEEFKDIEFIIYPNPAMDKIEVKCKKVKGELYTIEIYDLNGKKLLEQGISKGTTTAEIDVKNLVNGIYFCKIKSSNSSSTKKLIIQK